MTHTVTGPLIYAEELLAQPEQATLLDVRFKMGAPMGPEEYAAGHLPGAAYVDLDRDLAASPGAAGRHPLPSTESFEAAMRAAGVGNGRSVVVYDDWSGLGAGRCWWLLRYHGHRDVRLLDGGLAAWRAAGGPLESGVVRPPPGDFTVEPGSMPVVDAESVRSTQVVVDARTADRYRGEVEPQDPVAGRIPGAVNAPAVANLDDHGRFRGVEELRDLYAATGALEPDRTVAAYCGSGVTAVLDVIALELLGVGAALYPGSWSEWSSDAARSVETG